jgi:hypothetical protein
MKSLFNVFLVLFAGVWLFLAARGISRIFKRPGQSKWLVAVTGLLGLIGFGGFFVEMLSGEGIVTLPKSYEWPAGYVGGVKTTAGGGYVVPLVPEGRVQVYDSNWHFLRGWNVDAMGGDFKVASTPNRTVEVYTARGQHHYSFTENGDLLTSASLSESFWSLPNDGRTVVVPTSLLLWVFSGPAISWGVGVLGFIGLALVKKFARRPLEPGQPPISH